MLRTLRWALLCAPLLASVACKAERAAPEPSAAESSAAVRVVDVELQLMDGSGALLAKLIKRPDGAYTLKDGQGKKLGKLKVQADRVKASSADGQPRAKVKKKEDGFKLLDGAEKTIFKAKFKPGGKLKLKNEQGEALGKLGPKGGTLQGAEISLRSGPIVEVKRNGQSVARVKGAIRAEAASLLAYEGLDLYQQAALLVFVSEVL